MIPTCTVEMKRTGSSSSASAVVRPAIAALGQLLEARAPGGDERVLGRDEDGIPQHEQEHDEDRGEDRSRPALRGAGTRRYLVVQVAF